MCGVTLSNRVTKAAGLSFVYIKPVTNEQFLYDNFFYDKFYLPICTASFVIFFLLKVHLFRD